jgi:hypothetical protein
MLDADVQAAQEGMSCASRRGSVSDLSSVMSRSRMVNAMIMTGRSPTRISTPADPRTVIGRSVAPAAAPARAARAWAAMAAAPWTT